MKRYLFIAVDEESAFLIYFDVSTSSVRKAWEQVKPMCVGLPVRRVYLVTYRERHLIAHAYVYDGELRAYSRVPRGADVCFVSRELDNGKSCLFVKVVNVIEEEREIESVERCADRYYSSISGSFPDTSKYW